MKQYTKQTFAIFWNHAKKYQVSLWGTIISITLASVLGVVSPYIYKLIFDGLGNNPSKEYIIGLLGWLALLYAGEWIFWRSAGFLDSYFQTSVMRDLANTCFAYMHKHSFNFFNNNFVGSLVKRINRFYRAFEGIADRLTWDLLPVIINVTVITIVLSYRSIIFGVIIFAWVIIYIFVNITFSRYKLKYDIRRSELDTKVTGFIADTITNQSNIKLFSSYKREGRAFGKLAKQLTDLRRLTWDMSTGFEAVQAFLMVGLELVLMYLAIGFWFDGSVTTGDLVLLQAYLLRVFLKIWDFGRIIRDFYEQLADAAEMTEILETPLEIKDRRNAKHLIVTKGNIEFQNVSFYYHKTRPVFKKLYLKIKAGKRVAFVGPSGAGKSTIVKMLLRIHDIARGHILIDGQKIKSVTQDSLHEAVSLVPQDPILFHRTLMENIRYGKPDATDEQVFQAARHAHCDEFINQFPEGYATQVGERGVKLSGGERQRVAIARAILRNAPILVLDEATSSLDSESEALIQDALETLMKNKTVIVIAHRLSTIMSMDRIVVIDAGDIAEQGTHKQLTNKKNGLYKKLWKLQAGGFIE
jgi:ATP-binding cassette, subfamily B, bacterial